MRLAVITSQFPSRVSTFFARDMRALLEAGIDLDIFPVYNLDPGLWRYVPDILDEATLPRSRVHHLSFGQALFKGAGRAAQGARSAAAILASAARFGPAPFTKTVYVLPLALAWARQYDGLFDHVLGYWGNYAATCAYIFANALRPALPFSIFLHAGTDLYRDQVYLPQKIAAAHHVITCSDFNRGYLRERYPALFPELDRKLHVYHHGLDFKEFPFNLDQRFPNRVIAAGNFKEAKGFDYLLRAGGVLKQRGVTFEIELVGDGPQRPALEELARTLGIAENVIFSGWQPFDAVRQAMLKATLLVHPSAGLGDGVPNVIKEAIALGTPVIASNVSGIPEALAGGRHGILVPPRDVNALADAIQRLLASPELRRQFAVAGREYAAGKYDLWRNGRALAHVLMSST